MPGVPYNEIIYRSGPWRLVIYSQQGVGTSTWLPYLAPPNNWSGSIKSTNRGRKANYFERATVFTGAMAPKNVLEKVFSYWFPISTRMRPAMKLRHGKHRRWRNIAFVFYDLMRQRWRTPSVLRVKSHGTPSMVNEYNGVTQASRKLSHSGPELGIYTGRTCRLCCNGYTPARTLKHTRKWPSKKWGGSSGGRLDLIWTSTCSGHS